MKAKGIVSRTSNRDGRFGIEIDETWYNGFGEAPVKQGDLVEFDYEENPGKNGKVFKNVSPEDIEVITSAPEAKQVGNIDARARRRTDCILRAHQCWDGGRIRDWKDEAKQLIEVVESYE